MSQLVPEQRKIIGVILMIIGLISLVMTAGVVFLISSARAEAASKFTEAQESCKKRLGALGGKVEEVPGRIIWMKENIQEAPARLGEASVVSVLCPGWKLRTACVGTECQEANAMRVVLEPINPKGSDD